MAIQTSEACQRKTWTTYIETILFEAAHEIGVIKDRDTTSQKIDTTLRPFFFLTPTALADDKEKKHSSFALFASSVVTYFNAQITAAKKSVTKTEEYMNHALVLFNWHMQLRTTSHPLTAVSTDIQNLTQDVYTIDVIRARQVNDRFRARGLTLLGSITWIIGAFAPARWMVIVGKVVLAVSALYYGMSWLYHRRDQEEMKTLYEQIGEQGGKIRRALSYYDENMHLQSTPQINYQPSYFADTSNLPPPPKQAALAQVVYEDLTQKRVQ